MLAVFGYLRQFKPVICTTSNLKLIRQREKFSLVEKRMLTVLVQSIIYLCCLKLYGSIYFNSCKLKLCQ